MPPRTTPPDIVSNTGPLISLEKIGYSFIRHLYEKIIIPESVLLEISSKSSSPKDYLNEHGITNLIEVLPDPSIFPVVAEDLDQGEKCAITLALNEKKSLLIEEKEGRKIATKIGIPISGIAGQVILAYQKDLITKIEAIQFFSELHKHNRINQKLMLMLLDDLNAS